MQSHTSTTLVVEEACDYVNQLHYLFAVIRVHNHAGKNKEVSGILVNFKTKEQKMLKMTVR